MERETTREIIDRMLAERPVLSTKDVAQAARVSRQMAQKLLKALVDEGRLTIEGRARAAKYRRTRVDDSPKSAPVHGFAPPSRWIAAAVSADGEPVDDLERQPEPEPVAVDEPRVVDFRSAAQLWDSGSPYVAEEYRPAPPVVLDVASAGSLFRLSARMLLGEVNAEHVVLDFNGVMDVGDEFLEEVFAVWARAHPDVNIEAIHVPPPLYERIATWLSAG